MKTLIVYSSRTGNTKKVAEAIQAAIPGDTDLVTDRNLPADLSGYDAIFAGFWADKGTANAEMVAVLPKLHHAKVAVFATAGAEPASDHAKDCLRNGSALLPSDATLIGTWSCQGKIDPKIVEMMAAMFPAGHPHSMTPARKARIEEAKKHPDADDLKHAGEWALAVLKGASR